MSLKITISGPNGAVVRQKTGHFVDGAFSSSQEGITLDTVNPATGSVLGSIAAGTVHDVDVAVASARRAFDAGVWRNLAPKERKVRMLAWCDLMDAHSADLALMETLETGKPLKDTTSGDIPKAIGLIRWYAEVCDKLYDQVAPTDPAIHATITREPLGVIGAVVPWNFPLYLAAYKLGPALGVGCSVIIKPAEEASLTTLRAAELAVEAGIPPGVFNVVTGTGLDAGKALGLHPDVDMIAFTGSSLVAKAFLVYAGQSNMKKVQLEAGGKSANIVMPDAPDLDVAAEQAAWGIFYNQGQVCSAGSRLLVHRDIHDAFVARVADVARTMVVGDPLDPETQIGSVASHKQMGMVLSAVEDAKASDAELTLGGSQILQDTGGAFVEPTIFANVAPDATLAQEEVFGPVLAALPFDTLDEAIGIANGTQYGLGAAIWTSNIDTALGASRRLRAGQVWVNNYDGSDWTVPWGGFKQSGTGRDKALSAFDEYVGTKATWIALNT